MWFAFTGLDAGTPALPVLADLLGKHVLLGENLWRQTKTMFSNFVAFSNGQEFWDNTLERRWARASFCLASLADHTSFKDELWEKVSFINVLANK